MPTFEYQGRDQRGQAHSGQVEALSAEVVATQLQGRGIMPVRITRMQSSGGTGVSLQSLRRPPRLKTEDLIMFSRQMYTITKAGIPLMRGLQGLKASMAQPLLREVVEVMIGDLETGMNLSAAMRRHPQVFNNLYVSLVRVGEESGQLEACFEQLSDYLERDLDTAQRIKAALRYPSFVLIALSVGVTIVNVFVIPAFANMFKQFNAELPLMTRIIITMSDFFVAYWAYLLVVGVGLWVAFKRYVATPEGAYHWSRISVRLPLVGSIIYRSLIGRYARSFALMLRSGVPLNQALQLSAMAINNPYLAEKIQAIRQGVERGESLLRTHSQSGMFTPLVLQMIGVGEESGQVDTLLQEAAEFYEREVDYDLKSLSAKIEPIMIVAMAGFVLVLALGIFLPMWEMYNIQK